MPNTYFAVDVHSNAADRSLASCCIGHDVFLDTNWRLDFVVRGQVGGVALAIPAI